MLVSILFTGCQGAVDISKREEEEEEEDKSSQSTSQAGVKTGKAHASANSLRQTNLSQHANMIIFRQKHREVRQVQHNSNNRVIALLSEKLHGTKN